MHSHAAATHGDSDDPPPLSDMSYRLARPRSGDKGDTCNIA